MYNPKTHTTQCKTHTTISETLVKLAVTRYIHTPINADSYLVLDAADIQIQHGGRRHEMLPFDDHASILYS
jgi:hypothetical protein